MRSPDDALVQISNAKLVIFCVVGEKVLVQNLSHVIDRPWVRRVEDGLINMASLGEVDLNFKVPFGDLHASGAITINTHGAQVRNMDILAGFHNCCQKIVRGIDIVIHGIALVARIFHRIRRRPLLSKVNYRIRTLGIDEIQQAVVILGNIDMRKANGFP